MNPETVKPDSSDYTTAEVEQNPLMLNGSSMGKE
jgi:hypothetical protein